MTTDPNKLAREYREQQRERLLFYTEATGDFIEATFLAGFSAAQVKWRDISHPVGAPVHVKTFGGHEFVATYHAGISIDEDGQSCGAWVAEDPDKAPPCWTDGQCWASNENEEASDPVTHWKPLDPPPPQAQG